MSFSLALYERPTSFLFFFFFGCGGGANVHPCHTFAELLPTREGKFPGGISIHLVLYSVFKVSCQKYNAVCMDAINPGAHE